MISFNRCSLCLLINFLQDLCTIHYRFDQAHINTSRKNEALGSHPQVKMKINSLHALKTFTKNNSGQKKGLQTSCRPSVVFRITQHVCLCHGRSVKTDHKYGQRGKQFSITMIRMKSLFSHTWQTMEKKKNRSKRTKIKTVLRAAELPPGTGLSGARFPRIPPRMRTFRCCLQLQHWFFFTGQGKIFKGFHVCYDFSASKRGRKIRRCLFFLKQFVV